MSSVLERIVAQTKLDLAVRSAELPLARLVANLEPSERDFAQALCSRPGWPALIAELKFRSPSKGPIRPGSSAAEIIPSYAPYASAISVLCDAPFFGGGFDVLRSARQLCEQPLLCKDFIVGRYQIAEARSAGADAVLLMASVLDDHELRDLLAFARRWGMEALVETHDDAELERALDAGALVVGVNSRDLRTLAIDLDAMLPRLARVPSECVRVAESGIRTRADVEALVGLADAVLIGSTLMEAPDPAARIDELGWPRARGVDT